MTEVASSLLTSLTSGNSLLQPSYWLDPKTGVNYTVITQTHNMRLVPVARWRDLPLSVASANTPSACLLQQAGQSVRAIAGQRGRHLSRSTSIPPWSDHYTVQRVINVNAGVAGRDWGENYERCQTR